MAFQEEKGASSARATDYHDLLNKFVSFLTSRHVATVAVNNGGTATYVVGDIMTLTHAGAHLDAKFEVTSVSTGVITGLRIICSGAFGDRPNGTITVNAGGTAYDNNLTDLVLEIQGGSSRCPTKVLASTNGSGVVTSALDFEDLGTSAGGVYSSLPSYPAATVIVGPDGTAAGTGCTITFGGSTGIIGTTALAITGGSGGGSPTVDITLAETGWAVDGRNTNDHTVNSLANEKTVVLKGDATGLTNKPFIAYRTGTVTNGLNERAFIACFGLIAHNPALLFTGNSFRSPNQSVEGTFINGGAYLLTGQFATSPGTPDEIDFWMKADDQHCGMIIQVDESAAITDNGFYFQHYNGFMDRIGTESESAYPFFCFASSRIIDTDPKVADINKTGIAENRHTASGCGWFYDFSTATWRDVQNNDGVSAPGVEEEIMLPIGQPRVETGTTVLDQVVTDGTLQGIDFFKLDRSSTTLVLRKIPGTVDHFFLWPLTIMRRVASTFDPATDRLYGQVKGIYWINADDGAGARITNFSEDFVTVGGVRYIVFHNQNQINPYQYIAFRQDT